MAGNLSQYAITDHFQNLNRIKDVRCPTLVVHGQQDKMISYKHSIELV
jgi:abhydrolase domain-containing protein 17